MDYTLALYHEQMEHLQAEMVNALMRMKRHEQMVVEEFMTALNIPTRREMDTTHKRVHELQRQVRELQDALEESAEIRSEAAPATPAPVSRPSPSTCPTTSACARPRAARRSCCAT